MGVRLLVEVLDRAPADLTPAERLVLVVLAEDARDETRICWPGMDKLMRRTGLKQDSLRRVFQRLAKRGVEVRVPIKFTEKGPVFAREGVQTNYRIPELPESSRDESPPSESEAEEEWRDSGPASEEGSESRQDGSEAGLSSQRGGTVVPLRRDSRPPQEAGPASPPSPQSPSGSPQDSPQTTREARDDEGDDGALFPNEAEKQKTSKKAPEPGSDDDPEFCEWWALYSLKEDKGPARKAWKRARKKATFEQLMEGLKRYMTLDRHYLRGYVKKPATWLNSESWLNEYNQQPQQQAANGGYQPYTDPENTNDYYKDF